MSVRKICCLGGEDLGMMLSVVIAGRCPEVRVTFVDSDPKHIFKWNSLLMPEGSNDAGVLNLLRKVQNKNFYFTSNKVDSIKEAEIVFVVTNPEVKHKGVGKGMLMNLDPIIDAAQVIVESAETDKIVVECSCSPFRNTEYLNEFFVYNAKPNIYIQALSSPVFYDRKLGLKSLLSPDRVMIGHDESGKARLAQKVLAGLYERWISPSEIVVKKTPCVELSQIFSYILLGQKIASLCTFKALFSKTGHSMKKFVSQLQEDFSVVGLPDFTVNIGKYCNAIKSLFYLCEEYNLTEVIDYWKEVIRFFAFEETYNLKLLVSSMAARHMRITLFGIATDDTLLPETSLRVCEIFIKHELIIQIYDPKVPQAEVESLVKALKSKDTKYPLEERMILCDDPYQAARDSQLLVIHSYKEAWLEVDLKKVFEVMKKPAHLFDHFHLLQEKEAASIGFQVYDFFPDIF